MKKQLLTAAVAFAVALPMIAQAGIYGRNDGVLEYTDGEGSNADDMNIKIDKMRWGIVGSEDLGNGMKALYHYEWAMDNGFTGGSTATDSEKTRLAYVGLEGGWGKMTIGRNWWPSYGAVWSKTDTADAHGTSTTDGTGNNLSGNRTGDLLTYSTPNFSGFTGHLAMVISDETNAQQEGGVDIYDLTGEYKNGPLSVGVTYRNDKRGASGADNELEKWGIGASYSFGDLSIEGNYGNAEDDNTNFERDVWGVGATYKMGDTQISGAYRNNEIDGGNEIDDFYIGVRHFLSKETRIFAEYRNTDDDANGETDNFAVGLRKDWKL